MRRRFLIFAALLALAPAAAAAQYGVPGSDGALSISMSPQYPGPQQTVTLTLSSALYDVESSAIVWRANGSVIAQGPGVKSVQIQTGAVGDDTRVSADLSAPSGSANAEFTITPTAVDLLWESTSYTPPFYRGRALPAAGAPITLVAIPHFGSKHAVAPSSAVYTWRQDGRVLASLSGRGRSSATFSGPSLYGSTIITVDVAAPDGSVSGEASVRIADQSSPLVLYEDHPLYGILFNRALGSGSNISSTESSFAAIPFFAPVKSPLERGLSYTWKVNDTAVAPSETHPNEITINAAASTGIANVALELDDASNYFYSAQSAWDLSFGPHAGATANDPFHSSQ